jgi:hypothetical protein
MHSNPHVQYLVQSTRAYNLTLLDMYSTYASEMSIKHPQPKPLLHSKHLEHSLSGFAGIWGKIPHSNYLECEIQQDTVDLPRNEYTESQNPAVAHIDNRYICTLIKFETYQISARAEDQIDPTPHRHR